MRRTALLLSAVLALSLAQGPAPLAVLADPAPSVPTAATVLVGWNDLGMHCMDADYSVLSLLPPYNTIHAQLVRDGALVTDASGVTVTYEAVATPSGSINTTSAGKTDFWQRAGELYGASPPVDVGLAGFAMPGPANAPQAMRFDAADAWFTAEGIPITPHDDAGAYQPYPMMKLVARDASGAVIATTQIVLPVSEEMDCRSCHASGSGPAAQPYDGWVNHPDSERDFRLNVLRRHDDRHLGGAAYAAALAAAGYSPQGLYATAAAEGRAVLCARCHLSNALPGTGLGTITPLTEAIHSRHAGVLDPVAGLPLESADHRAACYRCHPGAETRCLRGTMGRAVAADGSLAIHCQSCHGTMSGVGRPGRIGWLEQPSCQQCHTGTAVLNEGGIRHTTVFGPGGLPRIPADSTFATEPDTPAPGLSLYRFSRGHGGLACEACHGSTHAESPSSHPDDDLQAAQVQGHAGMLVECSSCHGGQPREFGLGPHGMHAVGQRWVSEHGDALEGEGAFPALSPDDCRPCHGANLRGGVLSRAQADRTYVALGTTRFWPGATVGCWACHRGPDEDDPNPNLRPVAQDGHLVLVGAGSATVRLVARDADGDALTWRIVSQPAHGTAALTGADATYRPFPGEQGADRFTFAAWDGQIDSNLAEVLVSVAAAAGPDLAGEFDEVVMLERRRQKVRGILRVRNEGTATVPPGRIELRCSADRELDPSDRLLGRPRVARLRPGRERVLRFRARLPRGVDASGWCVLAVLDPRGRVAESDERDNLVVSGGL